MLGNYAIGFVFRRNHATFLIDSELPNDFSMYINSAEEMVGSSRGVSYTTKYQATHQHVEIAPVK